MLKIRKHLENLPPYSPIEPFEVLSQRLDLAPQKIIKMDANENPYGPSPKARQALAELAWPHIYPDPESRALRSALADFSGAPFENLMCGSGADELIDLLLRVMLEPNDRVLNLPPTFGMYPFDTHLNAGQLVEVPRRDDFSLDMDGILKAVARQQPKVLFLTTPNNPDGSFPPAKEIEALLDLDLLVVLDEAYIEFDDKGGKLGQQLTRICQVADRENLIVLRTFSKWAGLAGLRIGYGVFPANIADILIRIKPPYSINMAANVAAQESIKDREYLLGTVSRMVEERHRLMAKLKQLEFLKPVPSRANFILCDVVKGDAKWFQDELEKRGILIRYYNTPLLRNYFRISVGKPEHTDKIIDTLKYLGTQN